MTSWAPAPADWERLSAHLTVSQRLLALPGFAGHGNRQCCRTTVHGQSVASCRPVLHPHNMTAPLAMSTAECVQDPQPCIASRSHGISFDHREGALQLHRGDPQRSQPASSALLLPSRSNWHLLLSWCNGRSSSTRCDEWICSRAGAALNVPNEPRHVSRRPAAHELCQWKLYGYPALHQTSHVFRSARRLEFLPS